MARPERLVLGDIRTDGSGAVATLTQSIAVEFQREYSDTRVTVERGGTEAAFRKLCAGKVDLVNASRPANAQETETCRQSGRELARWPVAVERLAVVVNRQNSQMRCLSLAQLQRIWRPEAQGKLTNWQQVDPTFAKRPLQLYGAGPDADSFRQFTVAINGQAGLSRTDYQPRRDARGVAQAVAAELGALGYLPFAEFERYQQQLSLVQVQREPCMTPTPSSPRPDDPLSRPLFLYTDRQVLQTQPQVKVFVDYYLKQGPLIAKRLGYFEVTNQDSVRF